MTGSTGVLDLGSGLSGPLLSVFAHTAGSIVTSQSKPLPNGICCETTGFCKVFEGFSGGFVG